jgi:hypothetical protein
MIETLKAQVVPILRARDFKGSFPHYRRPTAYAVHLLSFQFDKWGGRFLVEIAICPVTGIETADGTRIAPEQVTSWHVHPDHRLRLGKRNIPDREWFTFTRRFPWILDPYKKATAALIPLLDTEAERWWQNAERQI